MAHKSNIAYIDKDGEFVFKSSKKGKEYLAGRGKAKQGERNEKFMEEMENAIEEAKWYQVRKDVKKKKKNRIPDIHKDVQ